MLLQRLLQRCSSTIFLLFILFILGKGIQFSSSFISKTRMTGAFTWPSWTTLLEMSTKPVNMRATTNTRTGCVGHGVGHKTPFLGRGRRNAAEDPRPNILQMNTEGLTADKISVIEQLAYKNKAFIIFLQETHCATADKLVNPNFSLAGSVLSRNHGLATFVHERLEWSLVDQSPEESETEWLCVDVAGHKIIKVYKPPRPRSTPTAIPTFLLPSLYVGDFNCQHVNGVTAKHLVTVRAWTPGQHPTTLVCCITQRKQPAFSLTDATSAPTQTWSSRVSARTADCRTDVS